MHFNHPALRRINKTWKDQNIMTNQKQVEDDYIDAIFDEPKAKWKAAPDAEKARILGDWFGNKDDAGVSFLLCRRELTQLFKFWVIKQFDDRLCHTIFEYGINGHDHAKHMVMALRIEQIEEILGKEAAEKAVEEAFEAYWRTQSPELRTACESGDWDTYHAMHQRR